MSTSGPDAVQIGKNSTTDSAIGGCDMSFSDAVARGYTYKKDDPRDIELKFLIKFVSSGSDNGFAIEGPTARHSGSGCCQGYAYKVDIQYRADPTKFRFRKEMWHVSNHTDPKTGEFTDPDFDFQLLGHDKFVGFGYCRYNKKDGAGQGKDSVILELWGNPDPEADMKNWKLIKRTEDKGGWGDDGDKCDGDDDQIGSWSGMEFRLKSNDEDGEFRFKHLSLREIDPTKDFDDLPDNPGTTPDQPAKTSTIKGIFKLQWDINSTRANPCAATGDRAFFEWMSPAEEHNLADNNPAESIKRLGELCIDNQSSLYQKRITKFDVKLLKVGSPAASPTVNATIRTSSNALKYTSPTAIDPTTLSGSLATRTFDFSTNTYEMQTGDKICVEYEGTSDTDYVQAGVRPNDTSSEADGIHSVLTYFDGEWHNSQSRDLACIIYENPS